MPALNEPFILTQPDGYSFKARLIGDEYNYRIETIGGYTIVQDSDKYWTYAINANGKLRMSLYRVGFVNPNTVGIDKHARQASSRRDSMIKVIDNYTIPESYPPAIKSVVNGSRSIIVVMINFTNNPILDGSHNSNYYGNLLWNSSNSRSMTNYFNETSRGIFRINGTVAGSKWYTSNYSESYWGGDGASIDDANDCIFNLAREALIKADSDINYAQYDADNDGILEDNEVIFVIIHADCPQEDSSCSGGDSNKIWSHRWTIYGSGNDCSQCSTYKSGANCQDTTLDGVRISQHSGENSGTYIMMGEVSLVGTFAHEMGHSIGLPDLYDTDYTSQGVGEWDIMGSGSWLGSPPGNTPGHFGAWSKYFLGWTTPVKINRTTQNVQINQIESYDNAYLVIDNPGDSPGNLDWTDQGTGTGEYFLIENRQKVGFDSYLPGAGLLIWHIDETRANNNNENRKLVDLEEAHGGVQNLDDYGLNRGDSGDPYAIPKEFTCSSDPNSNFYNGTCSINITNISASGSAMNFNVYIAGTTTVSNPISLSGTVNPSYGNQTTLFNYTLIYTNSNNTAPIYVNVSIDDVPMTMTIANASDTNYTDGRIYYYNTTLSLGTHRYSFSVFDGNYTQTIAIKNGPLVYNSTTSNMPIIKLFEFGTYGSANGSFNKPIGVTTDRSGNIYVADTDESDSGHGGNNRVQIFTSTGSFLNKLGRGFGDGYVDDFQFPVAVVVDNSSYIYISDKENDRIAVFDSNYYFVRNISQYGSLSGYLNYPYGLSIDAENKLYVVDKQNDRIQIFYTNGTFVSGFGSYGNLSGQFSDPRDVVVDYYFNKVYVTDTLNDRVQIFTLNGSFISILNGSFSGPMGIDTDIIGRVYIVDYYNNRIQVFHSNGTYLGSLYGNFSNPTDVFVDNDGKIYIADRDNYKIHVYQIAFPEQAELYTSALDMYFNNSNPTELDSVNLDVVIYNVGNLDANNFTVSFYDGINGTEIGSSTISAAKNSVISMSIVWMASLGKHNITVVIDSGNVINESNKVNNMAYKAISVNPLTPRITFGGSGTGNGQFDSPTGIAVDTSRNIYVVDNNSRVQVFNSNGSFLRIIGSGMLGRNPSDVAVDQLDRVFVADTYNSTVQVFSSNGSFIGILNSNFYYPLGISIGPDGKIYVADTNNGVIKIFNQNLSLNSQLSVNITAVDIAISPSGIIYVADSPSSTIRAFDQNGNYIRAIGSRGSDNGKLNNPFSISFDSQGNIYVADTFNNRTQIFNSDSTFNFTFNGNYTMKNPQGIAVDSSGRVYVSNTHSNTINIFNVYDMALDIMPSAIVYASPPNNTVFEPYTSSIRVNITTSESAVCRYSNTSGIPYANMSYSWNTTDLLNHFTIISGLSDNMTYDMYIRCNDTHGNFNNADYNLHYRISFPNIKINEFMPNPSNGNGWIEIYNMGEASVNITNWQLDDSNSSGSSVPYNITGIISKNQFRAVYSNETNIDLNATADEVRLINRYGSVVDNFTYYDGQIFGNITYNKSVEISIGRSSDGTGSWTVFTNSTPGSSNLGVTTYDIGLELGWNLISLPLIL